MLCAAYPISVTGGYVLQASLGALADPLGVPMLARILVASFHLALVRLQILFEE